MERLAAELDGDRASRLWRSQLPAKHSSVKERKAYTREFTSSRRADFRELVEDVASKIAEAHEVGELEQLLVSMGG
eukprot:SAG11_NODE_143_length_14870_cov_6.472412_4_plen_76_part_00